MQAHLAGDESAVGALAGLQGRTAALYDGLWTDFEENFDKRIREIDEARANNICIGSDQEWMRMYLGKGLPLWTNDDGVYEWNQVRRNGLQDNAAMVMFAGKRDPSQFTEEWVLENWHE